MAEAFVNRLGGEVVQAESAGTKPGGELNPMAVKAMEEIGYDMSSHYPKLMTDEMVDTADRIVTMGCGVDLHDLEEEGNTCPVMLVPSEDWGLEDPKNQPIEKVREIREQIKARVEKLIAELAEG